jgi:hypothetical protein
MNEVIKQYRLYDDELKRWDGWQTIENSENEHTIIYAISQGCKCQLKTFEQTNIEGWGLNE